MGDEFALTMQSVDLVQMVRHLGGVSCTVGWMGWTAYTYEPKAGVWMIAEYGAVLVFRAVKEEAGRCERQGRMSDEAPSPQ